MDRARCCCRSTRSAIFNANLKDYDQPLVSWQTYTLKKHETLEQVAAQFGISTARLKEINGINRHLTVPAGRTLLVPMNEETESSNLMDTWENPEFLAPDDYYMNRMEYRVKSGDSLYSIARANRISVAALKEWNRLARQQHPSGSTPDHLQQSSRRPALIFPLFLTGTDGNASYALPKECSFRGKSAGIPASPAGSAGGSDSPTGDSPAKAARPAAG